MTVFDAAAAIRNKLEQNGYEAYLVGGCVRDLMLGRTPKDYDVCTSATPEQVQATFEKTIPVGAAFGVIVVVLEGHHVEVATFRADGEYSDNRRPDSVTYSQTAKEDVIRRDFTINGLLIADPLAFACTDGMGIVDYVGGKEDLKAKVIRCIGDPMERFKEDALRMLRAVRFAAQLGFEIDPATEKAIYTLAESITNVSRERIAAELMKLVSAPYPVKGLVPLVTTGLMKHVLPSLMRVGNFALTLQRFAHFPTNDPLKGMAMLLVDGGGHYRLDVAEEVCHDLKLSNDQREVIVGAIRLQYDIDMLAEYSLADRKRLARKPGVEIALDLYAQSEVIGLGTIGPKTVSLMQEMRQFTPEDIRPKPLVTGDDLIRMGMQPGPLFSEILGDFETEQLNGVFTSREAALEYIKSNFKKDVQFRKAE